MKKIILISLALSSLLSASTFTDFIASTTDTEVNIGGTVKTDWTAQELSDNEANIKSIKIISSYNMQDSDLDGLSALSNLEELQINNNLLINIDLSSNTALKTLNLNSNGLELVSLPDTDTLTTISLNNNNLADIDVSKNTNLTTFSAENNSMVILSSFQALSNVETLDLLNNPITNIESLENLSKLTTLQLTTPPEVKYVDNVKFDGRVSAASAFCSDSPVAKNSFEDYFNYCKTNNFAAMLYLTKFNTDSNHFSKIWVDLNNDNVEDNDEINPNLTYQEFLDNKDLVKTFIETKSMYKYVFENGITIPSILGKHSNPLEGISEFPNITKLGFNTYIANFTTSASLDNLNMFNLEYLAIFYQDSYDLRYLNNADLDFSNIKTYINPRAKDQEEFSLQDLMPNLETAFIKETTQDLNGLTNLKNLYFYGRGYSLDNINNISNLNLSSFAQVHSFYRPINSFTNSRTIDLSGLSNSSNLKYINLSSFAYNLDKSSLNNKDLTGEVNIDPDFIFTDYDYDYSHTFDFFNTYSPYVNNTYPGFIEFEYRENLNDINSTLCNNLSNDFKFCGVLNHTIYDLTLKSSTYFWIDFNNDDIQDSDEYSKFDYETVFNNKDLVKLIYVSSSTKDIDMINLGEFSNLKSLKIISKKSLINLDSVDTSNLTKLDTIYLNYKDHDSSLNTFLSGFSNLKSLTLLGSYVYDSAILGLSNLWNLEDLAIYVDKNNINSVSADFNNLKTLRLYSFNSNVFVDLNNVLSFFKNSNELTSIDFKYMASSSYDKDSIDLDLSILPDSVKSLSLYGNTAIKSLIGSKDTSLLNHLLLDRSGIMNIKDLSNLTHFNTEDSYFHFLNYSWPSYYTPEMTEKAESDSDFCLSIDNDFNFCEYPPLTTDIPFYNYIFDNSISVTYDGELRDNLSIREMIEHPELLTIINATVPIKISDINGSEDFTNLSSLTLNVLRDNTGGEELDLSKISQNLKYLTIDYVNGSTKDRLKLVGNSNTLEKITTKDNFIDIDADLPLLYNIYYSADTANYSDRSPMINAIKAPNIKGIYNINDLSNVIGDLNNLTNLYITNNPNLDTNISSFSKVKSVLNLLRLNSVSDTFKDSTELLDIQAPLHIRSYADTVLPFENISVNEFTQLKDISSDYKNDSNSTFCNSSYLQNGSLSNYAKVCKIQNSSFIDKLMQNQDFSYLSKHSVWIDINNNDIQDNGEWIYVYNLTASMFLDYMKNKNNLIKGFKLFSGNKYDLIYGDFYNTKTIYDIKTLFTNLKILEINGFNSRQLNEGSIDLTKMFPETLEDLKISFVSIIPDTFIDFRGFNNLKTLSIEGDSHSHDFSYLLKNNNIENLTIDLNIADFNKAFPDIGSLSSLKVLDITTHTNNLNNLKTLIDLRKLSVNAIFSDKEPFKELYNLTKLNYLKIRISGTYDLTFKGLENNKDLEYLYYSSSYAYRTDLSAFENFEKLGENNFVDYHNTFTDPREGIYFSYTGGSYTPLSSETPLCQSLALLDSKVNNSATYDKLCKTGFNYTLSSTDNASRFTLTKNNKTYQTYLPNATTDTIVLNSDIDLEDYYGVAGSSDLLTDLSPYIYIDNSDGVLGVEITGIDFSSDKTDINIHLKRLNNNIETLLIKFKDTSVANQGNLVFSQIKVLEDLHSNLEEQGYVSEENRYPVQSGEEFKVHFYEKVGYVSPISLMPYIYNDKFTITTSDSCLVVETDSNGKYLLDSYNSVVFKSNCNSPVKVSAKISNLDEADNISGNDYLTEFWIGPKDMGTTIVGDKDIKISDSTQTETRNYYVSSASVMALDNSLFNFEYDSSLIQINYSVDSVEKNKFSIEFKALTTEPTVVKLKLTDPNNSSIYYEKWFYVYPYLESSALLKEDETSSFVMIATTDEDTLTTVEELKKENIKMYDVDSIQDAFKILKKENPELKGLDQLKILNYLKKEDKIKETIEPISITTIEESNVAENPVEEIEFDFKDIYGTFKEK